jgi:hypothetical protein
VLYKLTGIAGAVSREGVVDAELAVVDGAVVGLVPREARHGVHPTQRLTPRATAVPNAVVTAKAPTRTARIRRRRRRTKAFVPVCVVFSGMVVLLQSREGDSPSLDRTPREKGYSLRCGASRMTRPRSTCPSRTKACCRYGRSQVLPIGLPPRVVRSAHSRPNAAA